MAINETFVKGRKFRKNIENTANNEKWIYYSFITAASDVVFDDGSRLEDKMGSIKGVTNNENAPDGYAVDISLHRTLKNFVNSIANAVNNINYRLGGLRFYEDSNGKWVVGADSVPKKLGEDMNILDDIVGNGGIIEFGTKNSKNEITTPYEIDISQYWNYRALNADNFVIEVLDMQFAVYHNQSQIEEQTEYYINGAGVYMIKPSVEYDADNGIIKICPQRGTYNDGTYDRECNLDANDVSYFKAKIYLKS